jgi:hypothetical protein
MTRVPKDKLRFRPGIGLNPGRLTGSLLLRCLRCGRVCRSLYGARVKDDGRFFVVRADWCCRACAKLRYSSEGGYLCPGIIFRAFGNLPRPDLWLPYVFTSPRDAAAAGFIEVSEPGKSGVGDAEE